MSVFRVILSFLFVASLACEPTAVEETGYLIAEDVGYSSEGPLDGDVNTGIVVVGEPGSVTMVGGELTLRNPRTGSESTTTVTTPAGSFVLEISGRLDDELELTYALAGEAGTVAFVLRDDLSSLAPPSCLACVGIAVSVPNAEGKSTVSLSELELADGVIIVFNVNNQSALSLQTSANSATLDASVGDEICVYEVDREGHRSPTSCGIVPSD
jgi:hypothetical protein